MKAVSSLHRLVLLVLAIWIGGGLAICFAIPGWQERGQFGDLFGAVNALFSGLAFAGLYWALQMQSEQLELQRTELALQREELAATREELEGQRLQLQRQTETFALQRFEDSFFALLRVHGEIVNAMDLVDDNGRITRSRDCFAVWYRRLKKVHAHHAIYPDGRALEAVQDVYRRFYRDHQAELGHYFRHLYHIIKYVKQSGIENKLNYTSLVRAQLSGYEHLFLFYNGLSEYGIEKFKPLIEEFRLLENLPRSQLMMPELHLPLYQAEAYGDDGVTWLLQGDAHKRVSPICGRPISRTSGHPRQQALHQISNPSIMAKKARFFEVERQNGHEKWTEIVAAPSKSHINTVLNTPNIKVNSIKYLGFEKVDACPDEYDSKPEFRATVRGCEVIVGPNDPGFEYLSQQFNNQVQGVYSYLARQE